MTLDEVQSTLALVSYPGYRLFAQGRYGRYYIQATYDEADVITGNQATQWTRKWYISDQAVPSEVVTTALKCVPTSGEHRVRENFRYRDKPIFHPHPDIDVLWEIADKRQYRKSGRGPSDAVGRHIRPLP